MNVLNLASSNSDPRSDSATPAADQAVTSQPTRNQSMNSQANGRIKRPLLFPLAMTALMQPIIAPQRVAQAPAANNSALATNTPEASTSEASATEPSRTPPSFTVTNYYQDANSIPQYAVDEVAAATQADVVVNYPDPKILNPNQPATRGDIAALVHQVFVRQGKLEPLNNVEAAQYIVDSVSGDVQQ